MNDFLPKGYEAPVSEGNYFKFKKGTNTFRALSPAIVGWEYWTRDNKPVRAMEAWEEVPDDAKRGENGQFQKHFWAFVVFNYEAKKPQILEITQKTVQDALEALIKNKKWGSLMGYDVVIQAEGDGLERSYTVIPEPHTEAPKVAISQINLNALFSGEDPFTYKSLADSMVEDTGEEMLEARGTGPGKGEHGDWSGQD